VSKWISERAVITDEVQPSEIVPIGWDFAEDLATGEAVTAADVTITDRAGADKTSTVMKGSASIQDGEKTNSKVVVVLHTMTDGELYHVTILATVTADKKPEADLYVPVRDR